MTLPWSERRRPERAWSAPGRQVRKKLSAWLRRLSPTSRLLLSFAGLIAAGTLLLYLPWSAASAETRLSLVDAFFTSTSAVCVTGLSSIDVGARLSGFGQAMLLLLIQLGGLGFITFSTGLLLSLGLRSSMLNRAALSESLASHGEWRIQNLMLRIFVSTVLMELLGAVILAARFRTIENCSTGQACWHGLFHSVSAFCNAGFSTFSSKAGDRNDNLIAYAQDLPVNLTVMALIVLGGLGFLVLGELIDWVKLRGRHRLGLHTKIVLSTSAVLIAGGALFCFLLERGGMFAGEPWPRAVLPSLFQSVSARTAGYNSVDIGALASPTLLLLIVLMFIGGSPASAAGGVKTTTAFVIYQVAVARLITRRFPNAFGREIGQETVSRAATLVVTAILTVAAAGGLLLVLEAHRPIQKCSGGIFLDLCFETVSAFGTVGLSTGITPYLTDGSKVLLALLMYLGRMGPLTVFVALAQPPRKDKVRYPEEPVLVG